MKSMKTTTKLAAGAFALLLAGSINAAPATAEACTKMGADMEVAAKAAPAKVLSLVSAKVAEAPDCACETVKGAIKGAKADEELTGQIVEAAVRAAPGKYKVIVECAVAANPKAAGHIRAALQRVFGGKDGKGGKIVVVEPPEEVGMNPALAMAFIMQGLTPTMGLAGNDPALPGSGNPPSTVPGGKEPEPEKPDKPEKPHKPHHPGVPGGTRTNPHQGQGQSGYLEEMGN